METSEIREQADHYQVAAAPSRRLAYLIYELAVAVERLERENSELRAWTEAEISRLESRLDRSDR